MLTLASSRSADAFAQALPAAVEATRNLGTQQRWFGRTRWKAIDDLTEHLLDELEAAEASRQLRPPGAQEVQAIVRIVCYLAWLPVGDGS